MRLEQVEIGERYVAKVSGLMTVVRVLAFTHRWRSSGRMSTCIEVINERTGRRLTFRSAGRLRFPASKQHQDVLLPDRRPRVASATTPTYQAALRAGAAAGAMHADETSQLAEMCRSLAIVHRINPSAVFEGARRKGISARDLLRLAHEDPFALGRLQFEDQ